MHQVQHQQGQNHRQGVKCKRPLFALPEVVVLANRAELDETKDDSSLEEFTPVSREEKSHVSAKNLQ